MQEGHVTEPNPDEGTALVEALEALRLCRVELASVREQQETWAEATAELEHSHQQLLALSTRLAERLAQEEKAPQGLRARLRNRLLRRLPHDQEVAQIERLHATPLFDPAWYLREYPMVLDSEMSPALHYLRRGAKNGRNPGPHFDTAAYVAAHPEMPRGANPLLHYVASLDARPE